MHLFGSDDNRTNEDADLNKSQGSCLQRYNMQCRQMKPDMLLGYPKGFLKECAKFSY